MSKTVEKTLLSQNWAHKMFYVILHAYFKELQKYWNLQYLVKISPKITFHICLGILYHCNIYFHNRNLPNMQYVVKGWPKNNLCTDLWTPLYYLVMTFKFHGSLLSEHTGENGLNILWLQLKSTELSKFKGCFLKCPLRGWTFKILWWFCQGNFSILKSICRSASGY